jgi:hypothetical protein
LCFDMSVFERTVLRMPLQEIQVDITRSARYVTAGMTKGPHILVRSRVDNSNMFFLRIFVVSEMRLDKLDVDSFNWMQSSIYRKQCSGNQLLPFIETCDAIILSRPSRAYNLHTFLLRTNTMKADLCGTGLDLSNLPRSLKDRQISTHMLLSRIPKSWIVVADGSRIELEDNMTRNLLGFSSDWQSSILEFLFNDLPAPDLLLFINRCVPSLEDLDIW